MTLFLFSIQEVILIRPNLHKSSAFDSLIGNRFTFTFSGNQVVKNELIIRNNLTNSIVYQKIITSFQLFHDLDKNILSNGISYNAQLRVYDINNTESEWSNTIVFICLKTPSFHFSNLISNQIIQNTSYEFTLEYQQTNGEPLNSCRFALYRDGVEKYNTGSKFGSNMLSTTISGLDDNTQYQIRATGETLNGLIVDTGLISFSVDYIEPSFFAIVDLENLCHTGEIRIQSNIKSIVGTSNPSPPEYSNSRVILTQNGSWVEFDEGFSINIDFSIQLKCSNLKVNSIILELSNEQNRIQLLYMLGTFDGNKCAYFILKANNRITNYFQTSNYIDEPNADDELNIDIYKINQMYQMKVDNKGVEV